MYTYMPALNSDYYVAILFSLRQAIISLVYDTYILASNRSKDFIRITYFQSHLSIEIHLTISN